MTRQILLTLCAATAAVHLSAQSTADQILKLEEARAAATRSGQGREQFYSKDYRNISPPGAVVIGFSHRRNQTPRTT